MLAELGLKKPPRHIERSLKILHATVRKTEEYLSRMRSKNDLSVAERERRYKEAQRKVEAQDLAERLRGEHGLPPKYKLARKLLNNS